MHDPSLFHRRRFFQTAIALGISGGAARALLGAAPAQARIAVPKQGGDIRIQMEVRALRDPRTFDWSEMGNATRGCLQYLVYANVDGHFSGGLLENWTVNSDATEYVFQLKQGILWNDGTPFTAQDVAANFEGWADTTIPGNSMASRLETLIDPTTGQARAGAIEILDDHTVRITLSRPDVTIIPGIADYPAAIQRWDLIGTNPLDHGIGTGAFRITDYDPGHRAVLERVPEFSLGAAYLDRVTFLDLGSNPFDWYEAAKSGEIDMVYRSDGSAMAGLDSLGWEKSDVATATTVVVRPNENAEINGTRPYADPRVRRALALAVDNKICLELGVGGNGTVGQNDHVSPVQPDHGTIAPMAQDIAQARRLMSDAGMMDFEHELISVDDDWRRNTADAVAVQLVDAGFKIRRRLVSAQDFSQNWTKYPLSSTNWNHRELGIQVLSLAYRSGAAWNETGFANAEFDALLNVARAEPDPVARKIPMAKMQSILQKEGVVIQPFWQKISRHFKPGLTGAAMNPKFEIEIHDLGWT